jgi:polyisoprenoid-binding protein YceI
MLFRQLRFAIALLAVAGTASAMDSYEIGGMDAAHTDINFTVTRLMISKVHGNFDKFDGILNYDENKVEDSSVDLTIDATSIYTRNAKRDHHLNSPDFFDTAKFPTLHFKSTKVTKNDDGSLIITGDLTIRDVTKSITMSAEITGKSQAMGKNLVGFDAKTVINRQDYGVAWNMKNEMGTAMVGDNVEIGISGEGIQKK